MNILIYIGHPAQFHFFKNAIKILERERNNVTILIKSKDILEQLIQECGFKYQNIQDKSRGNSKFAILTASFKRTINVYKIARKVKADIFVGTDSSIAQAAWMLRKPAITTLEDDYEIIKNLAILTYPFTTKILVPNVCRVGKWTKKKKGYEGYMKLAYLHPNYFRPDESVMSKYKLPEKFILLRLAKLTAHHDVGIKGLTLDLVEKIINIAGQLGYEVRISSEVTLSKDFLPLELKISHCDIHSIMTCASLLISDSQSMSVEAAMLGLPSLRFSDFSGRISVLEELENTYGLTKGIATSQSENLLSNVEVMLSNPNLKHDYQIKRAKMLSEKIDVTDFLVKEIYKTAQLKS